MNTQTLMIALIQLFVRKELDYERKSYFPEIPDFKKQVACMRVDDGTFTRLQRQWRAG
jgi:hypothetical protein